MYQEDPDFGADPDLRGTNSTEFDVEGLGEEEEAGNNEGNGALGEEMADTREQELALLRNRLSDIEEGDEEEEDFDYTGMGLLPEISEAVEMNEEEGEAAFLAKYNEEYGEGLDDDNIPPRDGRALTVEKLESMIKLLEGADDDEEDELDEEFPDEYLDFESCQAITNAPDLFEDGGSSEQKAVERKKMLVLGPEHPKMKRFQAALKRHLERQIYLEDCKAREMEIELKIKRKEREELGQHLYNLQYELTRQSESVEKSEVEVEKLAAERAKVDVEAEEVRLFNQQLRCDIENELREETKLMKAAKEMDLMEWCIREALKDYDSQLKISQRVDERFQKLKTKAELDKKDQDIYLDRLMLRLQQMEQSNEGIQRQIQAHAEEQKELNTYITEATTEIEALLIEKKQLQRAWNETLAVVRTRDEALAAARKTLQKTEEDVKLKDTEVKTLMKIITKEQEEHEKETVRLKRKKMEERQLRNRLGGLEGQIMELQTNLAMLHQLKAQVEEDFFRNQNELLGLEKVLDAPRGRIQKLLTDKKELEDKMLEIIQEQTAMDKVAQGIAKQIKIAREKTQNCEDEVAKVENEMTRVTYECEVLRTDLLKKRTALAELEKKLAAQEVLLRTQEMQMKYADRVFEKKNSEIAQLNSKLVKLTAERENKGMGALEEQVTTMEKEVATNRALCVELQEKWLKLQDELVMLSGKRDDILTDNDLKRKEEFVLDRKRIRTQNENEEKKEAIRKLKKGIRQAQQEIDLLNSKLFAGKEEQENMENENAMLHAELMNLLKDAEMQQIELEDDINRLEAERDRLNRELAEMNDQSIQWEKKLKLAKELKHTIKKEQQGTSAQLKLAIHHMQVRHNNLRRAQEKLMSDLERCIDNRDRIIQQAEFDSRKTDAHPQKILINIKREEGHVRQKQRKLIKEAREAEQEVKAVEIKVSQLEEKVKCENETLESVKKIIEAADEKLAEAAIEKHKNLIEIILRQIKYKTLESVSLKRFQPNIDPKTVTEEIKKLEDKCYSIVELCDELIEEYPAHQLPIKLVKASILPTV